MNSGRYRGNDLAKVRRMTGTAILAAVVIVVQLVCTFIKFGPFSITLALTPIVAGAAVYGFGAGALLGAVLGLVVLITGILGLDGGTVIFLMSLNPAAAVAICVLKTLIAGAASAAVYRLIAGKSETAAVLAAGVVCPVVNTGLFILGMLAFFRDTLLAWGGAWAASEGMAEFSLISYIFLGLVGTQFLVELVSNIVLSGAVTRIIRAAKR